MQDNPEIVGSGTCDDESDGRLPKLLGEEWCDKSGVRGDVIGGEASAELSFSAQALIHVRLYDGF